MIVISRCKINNGERHVTREVTLSARKSIPPKNNFRGITMGIGPIWGITSLTFILSCVCISYTTINGTKSDSCVYVIGSRTSSASVVLSGSRNFVCFATFMACDRNKACTSFLCFPHCISNRKGP